MDVEAVIFDMDGVIVNSEEYWGPVQKEILETTVPDADMDFKEVRGMNVLDQYDYLDERYDTAISRDRFFELYDERADAVYRDSVELMEGFHDILALIRDRGKTVAICSSSFHRWIDQVKDRFDLEDAFDTVVSAEDIDGPSKPDPHIYRFTADRLDVEPEHCVVVEDSAHGVTAAEDAGMYCIGYCTDPGREHELSHADTVVHGPDELRNTLQQVLD